MVKLLKKLLKDPIRYVRRYVRTRQWEECNKQIERIKSEKELLRIALNRAGYNIPKGLQLGDWVRIIDKAVDNNE